MEQNNTQLQDQNQYSEVSLDSNLVNDNAMPVATAPISKKSKNKLTLFIAIGAMLLIIVLIAIYIFVKSTSTDTSPNSGYSVINQAVTAQFNKPKFSRHINYYNESAQYGFKNKYDVFVDSDFSNPSIPKSVGRIEVENINYQAPSKYTIEFRCLSEKECYIKYSDLNNTVHGYDYKLPAFNIWYSINPLEPSSDMDRNFISVISDINSVLNILPLGAIDGNALLTSNTMIEEGVPFMILSEDNLANNDLVYKLKAYKNQILELNSEIKNQYNLMHDYFLITDPEKVIITISGTNLKSIMVKTDIFEIETTFLNKTLDIPFTAPRQ